MRWRRRAEHAALEALGALPAWTGLEEPLRAAIVDGLGIKPRLAFTPLQSAGEEFVFRGYLTQAFGGLLSDRRTATVVAVGVPALLSGSVPPRAPRWSTVPARPARARPRWGMG